jgi:hypothetical protein
VCAWRKFEIAKIAQLSGGTQPVDVGAAKDDKPGWVMYPDLARLAIGVILVPVSSCGYERVVSNGAIHWSHRGARLHPNYWHSTKSRFHNYCKLLLTKSQRGALILPGPGGNDRVKYGFKYYSEMPRLSFTVTKESCNPFTASNSGRPLCVRHSICPAPLQFHAKMQQNPL